MCHPVTLICTFIVVTLSLFSLVSVLILLSYYANGDLAAVDTPSVSYGPGDTENVFFLPLFCQQLSPDSDTLYSSNYEPSYLYLLNKDPTLTGVENVTFEDRIVVFNQHKQRNFHLYPNSAIAFNVCADNDTYSGSATFYLFKGQNLYNKWVEDETSVPQYVEHLPVRKICGQEKQAFAYEVSEEDQYYLVFVADKHTDPQATEIVIDYNIHRTVHEFDQSSVVDSCRFGTAPCSVRVPFQNTAAALLVYGAPINWEDSWENVSVSVDCGVRVWFYAVMTIAGVLLIAVGTVCLCLLCCCCSRFISGDDDLNKPLLGQRTAHLYDWKSNSEEMSDPSCDQQQQRSYRATPTPHVTFRAINSPHPPPSFKGASGKFSLGSPTCETFTR